MKLSLCLEQTLGHRAHTRNLERATEGIQGASVVRVEYRERGRLPLPWTVRGSMDACRELRRRPAADVTFFHTQSIGLFAAHATRGAKYAISVDATPRQMDTMGDWYGHRRNSGPIEVAKCFLYRRVLQRAAIVVAWSDWAQESLVTDYGVQRRRVAVVHPGAPGEFFRIPRTRLRRPTILFVGGDFDRKGGALLLEAFAALREQANLLVVTSAPLSEALGVEVVRNASPGSPELLDAYSRSDIFCLPTFGDCTSIAIEEAMAAGLPVVTTGVGSNPSTVIDGCSGMIVQPGSVAEVVTALARLIDDGELRRTMGQNAREAAALDMDAEKNARRLVGLLKGAA